jgi:hypothetical protein
MVEVDGCAARGFVPARPPIAHLLVGEPQDPGKLLDEGPCLQPAAFLAAELIVDRGLPRECCLRLDPIDVEDIVARQTEIDAEIGKHRSSDTSHYWHADGSLKRMVGVDFNCLATCDLELEEIAGVMRCRFCHALRATAYSPPSAT